jgi:FdhD protein
MSISRVVPVGDWRDGAQHGREDQIAAEVPVALTYNRLSHVVMMATPADLEDFGLGFSLTEGIIDSVDDLITTRVLPREQGLEVAMTISESCYDRLATQRRNLTGRTGCGLCGAESLEQAMRYPEKVANTVMVSAEALQKALEGMPDHQPLASLTGATHCAAWCGLEGEILAVREDVGRHNALDKLIGHLRGSGLKGSGSISLIEPDPFKDRLIEPDPFKDPFKSSSGFLVISSRASYEMVFKAAAAGMEVIAAVSAPTTLAVDFAMHCGITLVGFARPGRHNIYTGPERLSP